MEKNKIIVPKGIRFISDWKEFNLPNFPCIINKQITGCGFTEYCLRNNQNVILISPRRILLENKKDQHPEENVYYFKNEADKIVDYDKDLNVKIDRAGINSLIKKVTETEEEKKKRLEENLKRLNKLKENLLRSKQSNTFKGLPTKILVTYDSFRHVKDALGESIKYFCVVVDEFQSIFTDSRFKSTTEMELLSFLSDIQNLSYVSATPMTDKYLDMLDYFKDLPYYEFDWSTEDPTRVIKPQLDVFKSRSINTDASKVIESYKSGNFERSSSLTKEGKIVEVYSKEAIFYVNSVKNICDIIRKNDLKPEECNVLCAKGEDNEKKIRAAFGMNKTTLPNPIGKVPKKEEPNKMFTFCTRTVYLGADFYSDNARSFIFSDANIECLAVDISLDLPQILGRQRVDENPWKNRATLYYRLARNEITQEQFNKYLQNKIDVSNSLLRSYDSVCKEDKHNLAYTYLENTKAYNYKSNFVAIDQHVGSDILPVFNNLVMISEMRSFEIQQVDYKDRFQLFRSLESDTEISDTTKKVEITLAEIDKRDYFHDKMRCLCEIGEMLEENELQIVLELLPITFKNYYTIIGPERMKALCYIKADLEREYQKLIGNQDVDIDIVIYSNFKEGEKYSSAELKEKLRNIYTENNYTKTPKATDINEYFETSRARLYNKDTKKQIEGFLLIKKLK